MVSLKWIEYEIDKAMQDGNNARNIHDLSALLNVRDHLRAAESPAPDTGYSLAAAPQDAPALSTIDEIEAALKACIAHTPDEARRMRDAQTMINIIKGD